MLIVVNPNANGGKAAKRWDKVASGLRERGVDFTAVLTTSIDEAVQAVTSGVDAGHDAIVAAGGDGSVNLVANALMDAAVDAPRRADVALGAIGLGSSNDFHKPFDPKSTIAGAPVRIDTATATAADVGKARMLLADGSIDVRYFLLNASMGLVAEGNHYFNTAGGVVARLKPINVELAIIYTALKNILTYQPQRIEITGPDFTHEGRVTNVGVLKSVHFAGGMHYDTDVTRTDGHFDVNVWRPKGKLGTIGTVAKLYLGKFRDTGNGDCYRGTYVELRPNTISPLELDGEITKVASARLDVLAHALRLCG